MDKTKIDWCDMSWNPITGCLHGCKYCYAARTAKRYGRLAAAPEAVDMFGPNGERMHVLDKPCTYYDAEAGRKRVDSYPFGFEPTFHKHRLNDPQKKKVARNIFVGSMADVFGRWVPDEWIEQVMQACGRANQHNYLFLTKNPSGYMRINPNGIYYKQNMWYGTTVTDEASFAARCYELCATTALDREDRANRFLSIEPLHGRIPKERIDYVQEHLGGADWVIIGAETGRRYDRIEPKREWVDEIVDAYKAHGIPVFLKQNIAEIWTGRRLIQEYPMGLQMRDMDGAQFERGKRGKRR